MRRHKPSRLIIVLSALGFLALSLAALALWLVPRRGAPDVSLAAIAVHVSECDAAYAALEEAGLGSALISPDNTFIVVSDFSRLLYLSAAQAFERVSAADPRRTPLIDALERSFTLRFGDEDWTLLYTPRRGSVLQRAGLALAAQSIPFMSSGSLTVSQSLRLNGLFWLMPLGLALHAAFSKPRHDRRFRLALAFSAAPLALSASVEALLAALALISCAKSLYDAYPLREAGPGRFVLRLGSRGPLAARLAPYAFFVLAMAILNPAILAPTIAALGLLAAALAWGPRLAALDRLSLEHSIPAFVPIKPVVLSSAYMATLRSFALLSAAGLILGFALGAAKPAGGAEASLAIKYERVTDQAGKPLELHRAYQASLTWGRLGEAHWGSTAYTSASSDSGTGPEEGEEAAPLGRFDPNALHSALDSGYIPVVRAAAGPGAAASGRPLDYKRLLFCILALIPGLGLLSYGRLRLA